MGVIYYVQLPHRTARTPHYRFDRSRRRVWIISLQQVFHGENERALKASFDILFGYHLITRDVAIRPRVLVVSINVASSAVRYIEATLRVFSLE